jgi:hypothetical protein
LRAACSLVVVAVACAPAIPRAPQAGGAPSAPPAAQPSNPDCYDRQLHRPPNPAASPDAAVTDYGLTKEAINEVVKQSLTQINVCYQRQLARRPSLEGAVTFGWTIEPSGRVSHAYPVAVAIDSPEVVDCVGQTICWWTFSAAPVPTTVGKYPFVFKVAAPSPRSPNE